MKTFSVIYILFAFALCISSSLHGQGNPADTISYKNHWSFHLSFGGGFSQLSGVPDPIYQDGHSNAQFGIVVERSLDPQVSLVSGVEIERITYSLDGVFQIEDDKAVQLSEASAGVKYTRLTQSALNVPLLARFYLWENLSRSTKNAYVQLGTRVSWSGNEFSYRQAGEEQTRSLVDGSRNFIWHAEFAIGFKGDFFKCFDLLNSSSLGVRYALQPLFTEESNEALRPIHFSWKFIF